MWRSRTLLGPAQFIARTITLADTPGALMAMSAGTEPGITIIRCGTRWLNGPGAPPSAALWPIASAAALATSRVNVRCPRYRHSMRYLMLMWADADATSGDESDFQVWAEFDAQVKAAGAFVLNGALAPAFTSARLVQTSIAGHAIGDAVQRRPFTEGKRQIQAFYIMDLPTMDAALEWANRLPTYGCVEVRELLQF
jgi:hypothetical protein